MFMASDNRGADGGSFAVIEANGNPLEAFPTNLDLASLGGGGGGAQSYEGGAMGARVPGHPSFAVEFDNWNGGIGNNDPNGEQGEWHTGINVNASVLSIVSSAAVPDAYDETGVHMTIAYSPIDDVTANVDVYVHDNDGGPVTNPVSGVVGRLSGDVVLGFTGATGGADATLEVDNIELYDLCEEARDSVAIEGAPAEVAVGTPVTLTAAGAGHDEGGAATYSWSVSGDLEIVGAADGATVEIQGVLGEGAETGAGTITVVCGDGVCIDYASASVDIAVAGPTGINLVPGDANLDGQFNISDPVTELNYLFGGAALAACLVNEDTTLNALGLVLLDHNGDGEFNISDAVGALNNLFAGAANHVLGLVCTEIEGEGCDPTCEI